MELSHEVLKVSNESYSRLLFDGGILEIGADLFFPFFAAAAAAFPNGSVWSAASVIEATSEGTNCNGVLVNECPDPLSLSTLVLFTGVKVPPRSDEAATLAGSPWSYNFKGAPCWEYPPPTPKITQTEMIADGGEQMLDAVGLAAPRGGMRGSGEKGPKKDPGS